MRHLQRIGLAACLALSLVPAAQAQYYGGPPPGYDDEGPYDRPMRRPPPRRAMGYNCDAVQYGISGAQPYSCPLPGPKPLGTRCFCDMPIASFSQPQTAVGRVSP